MLIRISSPEFFRLPAAIVDSEEKINHGFDNPAQPDPYKGFVRFTERTGNPSAEPPVQQAAVHMKGVQAVLNS
jgi:hypothetical protein